MLPPWLTLRIDDNTSQSWYVAHLVESAFDETFGIMLNFLEGVVDDVFGNLPGRRWFFQIVEFGLERDLAMKGLGPFCYLTLTFFGLTSIPFKTLVLYVRIELKFCVLLGMMWK